MKLIQIGTMLTSEENKHVKYRRKQNNGGLKRKSRLEKKKLMRNWIFLIKSLKTLKNGKKNSKTTSSSTATKLSLPN